MSLTINVIRFIKVSSASLNALYAVSFKLFESFTNSKTILTKGCSDIFGWQLGKPKPL